MLTWAERRVRPSGRGVLGLRGVMERGQRSCLSSVRWDSLGSLSSPHVTTILKKESKWTREAAGKSERSPDTLLHQLHWNHPSVSQTHLEILWDWSNLSDATLTFRIPSSFSILAETTVPALNVWKLRFSWKYQHFQSISSLLLFARLSVVYLVIMAGVWGSCCLSLAAPCWSCGSHLWLMAPVCSSMLHSLHRSVPTLSQPPSPPPYCLLDSITHA